MRLQYKETQSDGSMKVKVLVVSVEGIWHLYNLINVGDIVKTKTQRKIIKETTANTSTQRRTLTLAVRVTSPLEYDPNGRLRISGSNVTECEDVRLGAHHTLEVCWDPPQDVTFIKQEWDALCQRRLEDACSDDTKADTAAILMHNGFGQICLLSDSMCVTKAKVETTIPKKKKGNSGGRDDAVVKFYERMIEAALQHVKPEKVRVILIASPGHIRDEFYALMQSKLQSADVDERLRVFMADRSKFVRVKVSSGHRSAFHEAMADPEVANRVASARSAADLKAWNSFQELLAKDPDRCIYGAQAVLAGIEAQNVAVFMLNDCLLRSPDASERRFYTALSEAVVACGGAVHIFSSAHVTGENLRGITGIACILHHGMPDLDDIDPEENFPRSEAAAAFVVKQREQTRFDVARRFLLIEKSVTPNPECLRFFSMEVSFLPPGQTMDLPNDGHAYKSPLAEKLFALPGVSALYFADEYITVTKEAHTDWDTVGMTVQETLTHFAESDESILSEEGEKEVIVGDEDTEPQSYDDDVVLAIKELIATRIRPMVQGDGGNVRYIGIDDGLVFVMLEGACKTCPSSGATLKNGIERMLMHWIPEVEGVEEVDEESAADIRASLEERRVAQKAEHDAEIAAYEAKVQAKEKDRS